MKNEKEDEILRLLKQGKSYDVICDEVGTSPNYIKKVKETYEQNEAFELFAKGHSPAKVKIEVGISSDDADKYFLAYVKSVSLVDLTPICNDLGDYLQDFVQFYKLAKTHGITPHNMASCLELAENISFLQQENIKSQKNLQETRNLLVKDTGKLHAIHGDAIKAQDEISRLVRKKQEIQNEIEKLIPALDKIRNLPDYQILKQLIRDEVNSISSTQYFNLQASVIAMMKLYQKDAALIPLFHFPVPNDKDASAQTEAYGSVLRMLINESAKIMPDVLEELATLTGKRVLPQIPNLESLINSSGEFTPEQHNDGTTGGFNAETNTEPDVHSEGLENKSAEPDERK